jgi:hypothetical protein
MVDVRLTIRLARRPRLDHGVYKDNIDCGILCGEWCIGRICSNAGSMAMVLGRRTHPADEKPFAFQIAWSPNLFPLILGVLVQLGLVRLLLEVAAIILSNARHLREQGSKLE